MKTPLPHFMLAASLLLAGCQTPTTTATTAPAPAPAVVPAPAMSTVNLTGDWTWTCCEGHFSGTLNLQQDAAKLTGRLYDGGDTTGGTVDGTVTGNKVIFTRTWGDDSRQDYTLTISDDGNKLQGDLDGTRDESVGSHFEATRK